MLYKGRDNPKGGPVSKKSSDSNLVQHGGEGKHMKGGKSNTNWTPSRQVETGYTGPGRNLKVEEY